MVAPTDDDDDDESCKEHPVVIPLVSIFNLRDRRPAIVAKQLS